MNTIDLALDFELTMVPSEESSLELAPSDFGLIRHQLAECVLADFVDFRGIRNPKRWAVDKHAVPPQALYEYAYIQESAPISAVDDHASTSSISEFDFEDYEGVRHGYHFI